MSKEIILKRLSNKNFKGIKESSIDFGKVTSIFGENGTGKTTLQDSFSFLLFDKDSKDSTKFDVQPLDEDNNPIHNLETVIEAELIIDGREVVLKRVYKEKYSKVRGTAKQEFKGYESTYYVNEVPKKVTEYRAFINELLDENLFKLITNPQYFAGLPWKDRRAIITQIVGDLDHKDVIGYKKELEPLMKHLDNNTVDDFVKANKSKISQLKKDRTQIPSRIDEVNNGIHELDFDGLSIQRRGLVASIKNIDEQLQDKSKANEQLYSLKNELLSKQHELSELEYKVYSDRNKPAEEMKSKIRGLEASIKHLKSVIEEYEESISNKKVRVEETLNPKRDELLKTYKGIKGLKFEFDENSCICPTCKRKFENEDIESKRQELENNFNLDSARRLERNLSEGKAIKVEIEKTELEIKELERKISEQQEVLKSTQGSLSDLQDKLNNFKPEEIEQPEIIKIKVEIENLKTEIDQFNVEDTSNQKQKKQELQIQLQQLDKQLAYKDINEKAEARIKELEEEEAKLSEKIAELEGLEILSEEFIRTKVELLEEKVNSRFKYVKFKMFRNQINGGLEECCEPCISGVPFSSNLNTAAKINAGLDIINTLCKHYNVNAPIFIDNRESTNKIIEVESQIINLIVSNDKALKVEVV